MKKRHRRSVPRLESLEGRQLLSATPQFTVKDLYAGVDISASPASLSPNGQIDLNATFIPPVPHTAISPNGQLFIDTSGNFDRYNNITSTYLNGTNIGYLPESQTTIGEAVNDSGDVVGTAFEPNEDVAFLYTNNTMYDLNSVLNCGLRVYSAAAINDSGQILVNAQKRAEVGVPSQFHVLLLTPVPPAPVAPTITWANPTDIIYGTPLSGTQLDATADVPGTFTYSIPEGTVLHAGAAQVLQATFTPDDLVHYTTATATASINVLPEQFMPAVYLWANHNHFLDVTSVPYGTTVNAQANAPDMQPATVRFTLKNGSGTTLSDVTTNPSYGFWAIGPDLVLPAGSYTYVVKVTTTADWYQVQDSIHQFTITPAPLTVTANNLTKVLGQANPPLTGTITGLVNGDTDVATYTTTAMTSSPIGTYPVTPSLTDSNYNITFVNGTLTVVPPTISLVNGVVTINGNLDSGSVATVSFDQATGNVKVTLNGYTVMYARMSVRQINYIGSPNGHDTYSNGTNFASLATLYGGNNTCVSGPGTNYWMMYGDGNSIRDDGGVNYVYRHGFAVSETGTGQFLNLS